MKTHTTKICTHFKMASLSCCFSIYSLVLFSQPPGTKHVHKTNSEIENNILDKILNLPEVQKESRYVATASKGQRRLSAAIYQTPTKKSNLYWVKVWEDNGGNYVSHFNFFVNPKTLAIKYLDTVNDTLLDLKTWRQRQK